jgi:hypothetical protein
MMPPARHQEHHIVRDYALVIIVVCFLAVPWIIFNEVVMRVGNVGFGIVGRTGAAADIINFIILIYRIIPIGMILGVFVWCFMRAVKKEPYYQFAG